MIAAGKIIEYLDNGKFICAFVTELQLKRVHIFTHTKREANLPISRIVHCSQQSLSTGLALEQIHTLLQDTNDRRHSLKELINLEEVWETICDEKEDDFNPEFLAELTFAEKADDDHVSALLRAVLNDRIFFKFKEGKIKVHSREQVSALLAQVEREKQAQDIINKSAVLLQKLMQEDAQQSNQMSEEQRQCFEILQDYYLFGQDSEHRDIAKQILIQANLTRPHDPYHLLIKAGIWRENENLPLLRSDLPVQFSLPAIQQAEAALQLSPATLFADPVRRDLTHLAPLTIDGATTLDFDDALTIEENDAGYLLGVHISDVSHYVQPGDPLFLEAMRRGTSIYFPRTQIPMLPRHLSQGICSLIQGEIRATMSFMIQLSTDCEVLKVRIFPSIIKVARRLTYEEADEIMAADRELTILNEIAVKLRKTRLQAGALLLPFPDVNIHVDSLGKVHVALGATDTPSRILISEMMILANQQAAKYVADRMVPGLFRAQDAPRQYIVKGDDSDLFLNTRQRKQLSRGELLTYSKRHSGLGVDHYTTVTSPIRRLLDLVMQHQLHSVVRRQEPKFTQDMCQDFISVINRTLAQANAVKQQRHRYWLLVYLRDRIGHNLDALVIEAGPKRVSLLLPEILFDLDLPTPSSGRPAPGSTVKVKVMKSDPLDNLIKFEWS